MELSLVEIWHTMGIAARAVAISLVIMGIGSIGIFLERIWVYAGAQSQSVRFCGKIKPYLETGDWVELRHLCNAKENRQIPLARVAGESLESFNGARSEFGNQAAAELARRSYDRSFEAMSGEVRRGFGFLASVGSTAPFIGLFGTVIGIITAFQGIAASGGGGIEAVSAGIAEALIVTAVGLLVAIVAVLGFNYLSSRAERLEQYVQHATTAMLDRLEAAHGHAD